MASWVTQLPIREIVWPAQSFKKAGWRQRPTVAVMLKKINHRIE
jgi:hypothetical protein